MDENNQYSEWRARSRLLLLLRAQTMISDDDSDDDASHATRSRRRACSTYNVMWDAASFGRLTPLPIDSPRSLPAPSPDGLISFERGRHTVADRARRELRSIGSSSNACVRYLAVSRRGFRVNLPSFPSPPSFHVININNVAERERDLSDRSDRLSILLISAFTRL